ncbi:hypothetical protein [Senegalia sp. (in: firmicutes)]|uniref:hypothetical protein n=1 Tax=Senegalia sp. (in: firmicutes) TaxID=1924098 RepID=UPI003F9DED30
MKVGKRVNTGAGEVLILDIQKDYLILFNEENKQFIKANGYDQDDKMVFWNGGGYYNSFEELIESLGL